ncbi:MAG: proline dehydrogenase family protein, partial [Anaerolineales bacterium]|nr:proline dehydrogenase family protein [Anaerolineales bacterium]
MLRSFLIYLSKADWAQKLMTRWKFAWGAASRFVAGEKIEDAIRAVRELNARGINATLDHLGEHTSTPDEAKQATQDILEVIHQISCCEVRSNVSIKLTQIGLALDERLCAENLERIVEAARQNSNYVRIDMEDTPYTDKTLRLYRQMRQKGYNNVGMVVQSYLYRTEADTRALLAEDTRF